MNGCFYLSSTIVLLLLLAWSNIGEGHSTTAVYIDQYNGTDDNDCLYNGQSSPCSTISYAFKLLDDINHDITFYIEPGNYTLKQQPPINAYHNLTNVHFIGSEEDKVIISCDHDKEAGLHFNSSKNVSLQHLTFLYCGLPLVKAADSLHKSSVNVNFIIEYYAALSFQYCQEVTIHEVTVRSSNGVGLYIKDTSSTVTITNSQFIDNKISKSQPKYQQVGGGGGIAIVLYNDSAGYPINNTQYIIHNSSFTGNNATVGYLMYNHHTYNESDLLQSNGGGLAIQLRGESQHNTFTVTECYFSGNSARYGAGLIVQFIDRSHSNNITVQSSYFDSNQCFGEFNSPPTCEGGGARVDFIHKNASTHVSTNTAVFDNCAFVNNSASVGGGISLVFSNVKTSHLFVVNISNCSFSFNRADHAGSALFITSWSTSMLHGRFLPTLLIEESIFLDNQVRIPYNGTMGMGCVYTESIPIEFNKNIVFINNQGTGLVISGSEVIIRESTKLTFYGNTGHSGAAIALINRSWFTVYENSSLYFENNTAHMRGGAIYATQSGYQQRLYSEYCFIRYKSRFMHPSQWKANFTFINNTVSVSGRKNAIYALSMLACVWPEDKKSNRLNDSSDTFCWNGWNYDSKCNEQIETGDSYFVQNNDTTLFLSDGNNKELFVHPGREFTLPITFYNDKGSAKSSLLSAQIIGNDTYVHEYSSNGVITLYGKPNTKALLILNSIYPRIIQSEFNVTFLPCPPGFSITLNNFSRYECQCSNNYGQSVICDANKYLSYIQWGYYMTYDGNETLVAPWVVQTEVKFIPKLPGYIQLSSNLQTLNRDMCASLGRTGFMCSKCLPDKSAPIYDFSYKCVDCKSEQYYINWLYFILLTFLPITIFFLIVVIFNISTTSGPANAFICFAQIIANPITVTRTIGQLYAVFGGHTVLLKLCLSIFIAPYGIWNLDFLQPLVPPFCIGQSMKSMHAYAINYITAFYPLILIIISYALIEMHASNVRFVKCIWRPFSCCVRRIRRNWDLRSSVIDAFATFLLLSYSKFCLMTFYLLVPVYAFDANGTKKDTYYLFFDQSVRYLSSEHVPFFLLAVLVLFFVILPPPIFLCIFPTRCFQKIMNCFSTRIALSIRMFVEPFQGCYKDGVTGFGNSDRRFFSSFYFIFRILAFSSITLSYNIYMQRLFQIILVNIMILSFTLLKPYKDDFYNKLDPAIFTALLIAVTIGMYNAAVPNDSIVINIMLVIIVSLPLIYMICYVARNIVSYLKICLRPGPIEYRPRLSVSVTSRSYDHAVGLTDSVGSLPDRIINPKDYFDNENERLFTTSEVHLKYGSSNNNQ